MDSVAGILAAEPWTPSFHDSEPLDWAITLGYFAAAGLCSYGWRRGRSRERGDGGVVPQFWLLLGVIMVLLGINKQLNFQTLLGQVGRDAAAQEGWYEHRRAVQKLFVIGFAAAGLLFAAGLGWWVRRVWRECSWGLVGLCFAGAYAVVRAATFHHVLANGPQHHPLSQEMLEIIAIGLVSVGAWRAGRPGKTKLQAFERFVRVR